MNPNAQPPAPQQGPPTPPPAPQAGGAPQGQDQTSAIYEQLRQILMKVVQAGIPGIDQVLNTLNQQHVKILGNSGPVGSQPASPQNPTPQGSYKPFG